MTRTTGLFRSVSFIPTSSPKAGTEAETRTNVRGGETEPNNPAHPIRDPELRAAFMRAHYEWAKAKAPWLLEGWLA